jgi:S-adenosylmethionine hydrolase
MLITLTSDMGLKDYYVAAMKGAIYSQLPDAKIVDISHNIPPFDILHASFVLKNTFKQFPKNTIHIIGVDAEKNQKNKHLIVKNHDQYFIGADNGIFSLIFDKKPDGIWDININKEINDDTFPSKDIFIPIACHLARGGLPSVVAKETQEIKTKQLFRPIINNNSIKAMVCYIDKYGNLMTNVT